MQISVALNGSKRRDIEFYKGDDNVIDLIVYEQDGDEDPIVVSNVLLVWGFDNSSLVVGDSFVVGFYPRSPYRIVASVNGLTTTLVYGLINRAWDPLTYACCSYWNDDIFTHVSPYLNA